MRFGRDQGIYAVVADTMLAGGMPYRDAWDSKPPGFFLVCALARGLLGPHEWSIRVLEVHGFASLIPAFAVYAKRFLGDVRPGLMALGAC
jgi:4-amino-4-deoxy-L-arabinose transferase-like glycosyltransferase